MRDAISLTGKVPSFVVSFIRVEYKQKYGKTRFTKTREHIILQLVDESQTTPDTMPAQVAPQATKPRRKRDQSRLYPETPIGRVINMTPEGKAYFASAPIAFNSALHYAARHTKIKAKRLRKMFQIQRREAATILRKLQGIRESNRSNKENQIRVTEDHITKTKAKLAKMQKTGRSKWMGPTKDKVQRLTDKLNKQLREKGDPSIFFGHSEFRDQPVKSDYDDPVEFEAAYARFRDKFERARFGRFGSIGSHEELYGNQTYELRADEATQEDKYFHVPIWHSRELLGQLRLEQKDMDRLVSYQKTHEAVTIYFVRDRNHWMCHATLMCEGPLPYAPSSYTMAFDINGKKLMWLLYHIEGAAIKVDKFDFINFVGVHGDQRRAKLKQELAPLLDMCVSHLAQGAMEDLDLRKKKALDNGKALNAVLGGLPYAEIMEVCSREFCQRGVPLRLVNPAFTSSVGGIFTPELTELGRDHGACITIGLLGSDADMRLLNERCKKLLKEGGQYRTTMKGQRNLTVTLTPNGSAPGGAGPGGECKTRVIGDVRPSAVAGTAHSRPDLRDFYMVGRSLIRMMEKLYAPESELCKRRSPKGPRSDCPWRCIAHWKSNDFAPVMHELAAGSLNAQNPLSVWADY